MKQISKIALTSLLATSILSAAYAQEQGLMTIPGDTSSTTMMMKKPNEEFRIKIERPEQVLEINGRGQVLMRGTVQSVTPEAITVKSWGGVWTVKKAVDSAEVISQDKTLATFVVGDFVGVKGRVTTDSTLTIEGSIIRNRSFDEKRYRQAEQMMKKEDKMNEREGKRMKDMMMGSSTPRMDGAMIKEGNMSPEMQERMMKEVRMKMELIRDGRQTTPPPTASTTNR